MVSLVLLAGPDDCMFENENQATCHWKNSDGYPLKWSRNTGGTPSSNTGPSGDATNGFNGSKLITGYYQKCLTQR